MFIKEEYRGRGLPLKLIEEALEKGNPGKESVFITLLDDGLGYLYEKVGFRFIADGNMVRAVQQNRNISLDEKIKDAKNPVDTATKADMLSRESTSKGRA